jgi:hypothetical protein
MLYDTHIMAYDPMPHDTPEDLERTRQRIQRNRQIIRELLPRLRALIEDPKRDPEDVFQVLRPYHLETNDVPMGQDDLPELEALCRLVLEKGGRSQQEIQCFLLRLIGSTASEASVPFLLEMLHYSRRGDNFGPERRQLALWGLARIAIAHNVSEAYTALWEGLEDHHANVRYTTADLILNAYLDARRDVPEDVVKKLRQMAATDPDKDVRQVVRRYLREPWATKTN